MVTRRSFNSGTNRVICFDWILFALNPDLNPWDLIALLINITEIKNKKGVFPRTLKSRNFEVCANGTGSAVLHNSVTLICVELIRQNCGLY